MPTNVLCAGCGAELVTLSADGYCTRCRLEQSNTDSPYLSESASSGLPVAGRIRYLGDYELLAELARGGMGIVYSARQISLGKTVALKVIAAGQLASSAMIERLHREAEIVARLDHPNIVPVYAVGDDEGFHFFSMRLVPGGSLADCLARGRRGDAGGQFTPREAAELVLTTSRAIQHVHDRDVYHRDLKPGNILLGDRREPMVVDFGLACIRDEFASRSGEGGIMGTLGYMSPEQAAGKTDKVAAVDIYGLGAVLYELLTGRPPFVSANPVETLRQVLEQEPTRPRQLNRAVDRDLETICLKCLEKNPAQRYSTAAALANDLDRWLRLLPIHACPAGRLKRMHRWCRRNPGPTALTATISVALVVTLALLLEVNASRNKDKKYRDDIERRELELKQLARVALNMVEGYLEDLWSNPNRRSRTISSDEAYTLCGQPPRPFIGQTNVLQLVMGVLAENSVMERIRPQHLMVEALEEHLEACFRRSVRIDYQLYKFTADMDSDLRSGQIDFARMGALRFLRLVRVEPGMQPLVVPNTPKKGGLLFTRQDSPLRTLNEVRDRRLALGEINSTVSYWAQIQLLEAGIRASDLADYDFLNSTLDFAEEVEEFGLEETVRRHGQLSTHGQVVEAVLDGRYDVGVTTLGAFRRIEGQGLVKIPGTEFGSSRTVLVARPGLEPTVVETMMGCLTNLSGEWLQRLPERSNGFQPVTRDTFAIEARWLDRIEEAFPLKASPASP